jgi:hypothetical protein
MSNSYTTPPTLVDPSRVTAGLTLRTTEVSKLGELQNYAFAHGGCVDAVAQAWGPAVFRVDATSPIDVCEWYIPRPSNHHNVFKLRIACHRTASGNKIGGRITFPLSANSYDADVAITDSTRYGSAFEELNISVTASENEIFCKLTLFVECVSGYVEISNVNGNWTYISSPLSTGVLQQESDLFIPQGINRLGADRPLSARFGVETLSNITTLRKRGRTLLNWSGSFDFVSGNNGPPKGLGTFDLDLMYSIVSLFGGMNQQEDLDVDVFINVENYVSGTFEVEVFGYRLAIVQNGWNRYGLSLRLSELERYSRDFRLSMYQVGLMSTTRNQEILLGDNNRINSSPVYIKGLSIIGV